MWHIFTEGVKIVNSFFEMKGEFKNEKIRLSGMWICI